jgi:hypothetical protein
MSNENSRLDYESGVTPTAMSALTDSGDRTNFTSAAALFSESTGNSPDIRPNGLLTGGAVIPAVSLTNDLVDVAALTCYLAGVNTSVSAATDETIARAATDVASISSITIDNAGAVAIVKGTDSADATFVETRAAAGGPPLIPTDSIEIAQVRTTSNTAAAITAAEIFNTIGTHTETSSFPVFTGNNALGEVDFDVALPAIHTGAVAKAVFASYAAPVFTEQSFANDFVPSETSYSVSSEQVYGATVGASSSSLGQGSFTAILSNGITDNIVGRKGENLWFRYFQDKNKLPHILDQGKLGLSRTFGASDNPKVSCTISPTVESVNRAS